MSKEYIADKETLDELNQKLGVNTDAASGTSLFAKVNSLLNTVANHVAAWTSARAAKLDNLDNIGATSDTGGSTTAGTVLAKLNALLTSWTSTRAGYIDNIRSYTITNNTASKTGVLSAKLAYIISLLENATYKYSSATKITHACLGNGETFSGSGKGIVYVFPVATDTSAAVTIDGNNIGTVYGGNGNSEAIKIEFRSSFKVVNNGSRNCYCDAVFY